MVIQLFDAVTQEAPSHEFTASNPPSPADILYYTPTGNHYVYFSRSKGVMRFRKAEIVAINVAVC